MNTFAFEDYQKYKLEQKLKVNGWFLLGKPALSINDAELLKQIQVKDFNHFVDRNEANMGKSFQEGGSLDRIWGKSLDNAMGETWKTLRHTFTPIFTPGKMKIMLEFIKVISRHLTDDLAKKAKAGEEIDLKDSFGKYSLDGLASCAFGMDAESFTNEKSVFVKYAAAIFNSDVMDNLNFLFSLLPGVNWLKKTLDINVFKPQAIKYFKDVIMKNLEARRKSTVRRNDLLDLMLDAMKGEEKADEIDSDLKLTHDKKGGHQMNDDDLVATAIVMLVAGYDTTGITLSYLAYAMSKNPEIQEKLQAEVDQTFEENNGELPDYTTINALPYMDMVLHETLRKFNPVQFNTRSCTQDYRLPGTDILIKKDDLVTFSVQGLHHDPEYFSHPDQFYPEHFSKEEKDARHPYAYQAFGQGPRSCIGMRFALLEAKVAILTTFHQFTFLPGTRTQEPLVADPEHVLGYALGGVWARIVQRER